MSLLKNLTSLTPSPLAGWRILLLTAALSTGLLACGDDSVKHPVNLGDPAPAFRTTDAAGAAASFPEDFAGKPLVIRFWADWCKYCESEMQAIEQVYQRHRQKGLRILAINTGQDAKTVTAYIQKIGVSYPALLDEQSSIARSYGVVGLPTTFFVDAGGVIRAKIVGEADEATFERHAVKLIQ